MRHKKTVYVFDNDGTLYACPKDFEKAITDKIIACIARFCSVSTDTVLARRKELFRRYNVHSTLLVFYYEGIITDVDNFVQNTYLAVDPSDYGIQPNLQLRRVLENLGFRYMYTQITPLVLQEESLVVSE